MKNVLLRGQRIGIIGAGTMGQALIKGLLANGVSRDALRASDPTPATRRQVTHRFRIRVTGDNLTTVRGADVVVLAVKPQQFPDVVLAIAPYLAPRQLVVSIAAGITLQWLRARLPGQPLIRVMPNLPATVGSGFSAVTAARTATARHRRLAMALFRAVGEVVELPERLFDAVTAVSGSGPAYVFFLIQAWEEAAKELGLPPSVAAQAIRQTLKGSVRVLEESHDAAAVLMQRVASKGGTTEAALRALERGRVRARIIRALYAAARRSQELAWS